jgi:uncharacterized protein YkwD
VRVAKQNFGVLRQLKSDMQSSRAFILVLVLALSAAAQPSTQAPESVNSHQAQRSSQPTPKLLSAAMPSSSEDTAAESALLELAKQSRRQAGLPPLQMDVSLRDAARAHAHLMVARQQLSHRFSGEPTLMERLLDTGIRLDQVGENVAYHSSVAKAFSALMNSAPHRENLLDPHFNLAGFAAYWSDGRLYVVQDFAHSLPQVAPASRMKK